MTLQLTLPTEIEKRLHQEAERRGEPTEAIALRLLDEHLPPRDDVRQAAALELLQNWAEEDAGMSPEVAAGNADVLRLLDEDRLSHRKLFTDLEKVIGFAR